MSLLGTWAYRSRRLRRGGSGRLPKHRQGARRCCGRCRATTATRTSCTFRHTLISEIEKRVEDIWSDIQYSPAQITKLRQAVMRDLENVCRLSEDERQRQEKRLIKLAKQRAKAK